MLKFTWFLFSCFSFVVISSCADKSKSKRHLEETSENSENIEQEQPEDAIETVDREEPPVQSEQTPEDSPSQQQAPACIGSNGIDNFDAHALINHDEQKFEVVVSQGKYFIWQAKIETKLHDFEAFKDSSHFEPSVDNNHGKLLMNIDRFSRFCKSADCQIDSIHYKPAPENTYWEFIGVGNKFYGNHLSFDENKKFVWNGNPHPSEDITNKTGADYVNFRSSYQNACESAGKDDSNCIIANKQMTFLRISPENEDPKRYEGYESFTIGHKSFMYRTVMRDEPEKDRVWISVDAQGKSMSYDLIDSPALSSDTMIEGINETNTPGPCFGLTKPEDCQIDSRSILGLHHEFITREGKLFHLADGVIKHAVQIPAGIQRYCLDQ